MQGNNEPFSFIFIQHDLTFRIESASGQRVAVCYRKDTAELLVAALNAYRPG
jgi:hypothetical protein